MTQVAFWNALLGPGITALVGAGGKTTILTKMVEYGGLQGIPTVVTTTTKLYETQVVQWNPYYGEDFNEGERHMLTSLERGRCGAWFAGVEGTKVVSLPSTHIDSLHEVHPMWQILVEADGAKERWVKAPKSTEPVIPKHTKTTVGVVNLQILGKSLSSEYAHNLEELKEVLQVDEGTPITPRLLAKLVMHRDGLFQYSRGYKVLFGTGYDTVEPKLVEEFLTALEDYDLRKIILADGYKASCEIRKVILWQSV